MVNSSGQYFEWLRANHSSKQQQWKQRHKEECLSESMKIIKLTLVRLWLCDVMKWFHFQIGKLLGDDDYQRQIVPCVVKLFSSNDRATRIQLLQQVCSIYFPFELVFEHSYKFLEEANFNKMDEKRKVFWIDILWLVIISCIIQVFLRTFSNISI